MLRGIVLANGSLIEDNLDVMSDVAENLFEGFDINA